MKTSPKLFAALLFSVCPIQSQAQDSAPIAAPVVVEVSTVGETNALISAINSFRAAQGLGALAANDALSAHAAKAFPEAANSPKILDVTELKRDFQATDVAVLRGVVTHRGEKSGAQFPKYWAEDPQWKAVMVGDFTDMGAATVKRSDGKLVAFVYLIKK
jgi:hypothetical protein